MTASGPFQVSSQLICLCFPPLPTRCISYPLFLRYASRFTAFLMFLLSLILAYQNLTHFSKPVPWIVVRALSTLRGVPTKEGPHGQTYLHNAKTSTSFFTVLTLILTVQMWIHLLAPYWTWFKVVARALGSRKSHFYLRISLKKIVKITINQGLQEHIFLVCCVTKWGLHKKHLCNGVVSWTNHFFHGIHFCMKEEQTIHIQTWIFGIHFLEN